MCVTTRNARILSSDSTCGNAPDARRIGEFDGSGITLSYLLNAFRVIQQRAGEWLLKQLNQTKDSEASADLNKEKIFSAEGEKKVFVIEICSKF